MSRCKTTPLSFPVIIGNFALYYTFFDNTFSCHTPLLSVIMMLVFCVKGKDSTMTQRKHVEIFTDGACSGNPGPGGYGVILRYKGSSRELSGGDASTTNNRMEMSAVIAGLSALKEPCDVTLYSDSKYVIDAIQKGWAVKWKANGWMRNKKEPALNSDLWEKLLHLLTVHNVEFVWVKGHAGHPENERCDTLAVEESQKHKNI